VRVADLFVDIVDGRVQELFINEKRIELEARALLSAIACYRNQTDQWLAATKTISNNNTQNIKPIRPLGNATGKGTTPQHFFTVRHLTLNLFLWMDNLTLKIT
jgi:hypothetical protein